MVNHKASWITAFAVGASLLGASADAHAEGKNRIGAVTHSEQDGTTSIRIRGSEAGTFTVYRLERPTRIVIDIAKASLAEAVLSANETMATMTPGTWAVSQISAQAMNDGGPLVRIMVTLARPGRYDVKADKNDIVITVTARDAVPVSADARTATAAKSQAAQAVAAKQAAEAARAQAEGETRAAQAVAAAAKAEAAKAQTAVAKAEASIAASQAEVERMRQVAAKAEAEARRMREKADAEATRAHKLEVAQQTHQATPQASGATVATVDDRAVKAARAEADRAHAASKQAAQLAERAQAEASAAAAEGDKIKRDAEARVAAADRKAQAATQDADVRVARAEAAAAKSAQESSALRAEKAAAETARKRALDDAAAARKALAEAETRAQAQGVRTSTDQAKLDRDLKTAREALAAAEMATRDAQARKHSAEASAASARADAEAAVARRSEAERHAEAADQRRVVAEAETQAAARLRREHEQANRELAKRMQAQTEALAKAERSSKAAADAERAAARRDTDSARAEVARTSEAKRVADAELANKQKAVADAESALARIERDRASAEGELTRTRAAVAEAKVATPAPVAKPAPTKAVTPMVAVRDVSFEGDVEAGTAEVVIELGGKADARLDTDDPNRPELVLTNVVLPEKLERRLDVRKFGASVTDVATFRDRDDANRVRVVMSATGAAPSLVRDGNTLRVKFAPAQVAAVRRRAPQNVPSPVVSGYGATSAPVAQTSVAQVSTGSRRTYRGQPINLDFKEAPIHDLLRALSDVGNVNIVVPDDIKASVTVRMKQVPWDQALDVILASKGLGYRREGRLYRVAPRKDLDAEDEAEAARRRLEAESEQPEPKVLTLNYADAEDLKSKLAPMLSPKGKIEVDSRTNALIVNDIMSVRSRIAELALSLDTETPQISIESRIVEARSTFAREIGVQWGGSASASANGGNATGLIFPSSVGVRGGANDQQTNSNGVASPSDFAVNLPAAVGQGSGGALGLALGSLGGNFNINLRLSALEDQGSVRITSSTKIVALNNVKANITQGVRIPISVVSAQGTQTQFVPAELSLEVTPYVSQRDCKVAMDIHVTKNEPDFVNTGARGDPTILSKEASTKILVADGETAVMGGIYTRNTGLSYSKVPFFGDLPVLGWLFKNRRENDERTEVLVFITPKITNKASLRCE